MDIWYKNNMGGLQRLHGRLLRTCRSRLVKLYVLTQSQQEEILTKIEDAWIEGKISSFVCPSAPGTEEYETSFVNYVAYQILPNKTIDYFRAKKNHRADSVDDWMEETVLAALGEATPAKPFEACEVVKVTFNPETTIEEITDVLKKANLKILSGPSNANEYVISRGPFNEEQLRGIFGLIGDVDSRGCGAP